MKIIFDTSQALERFYRHVNTLTYHDYDIDDLLRFLMGIVLTDLREPDGTVFGTDEWLKQKELLLSGYIRHSLGYGGPQNQDGPILYEALLELLCDIATAIQTHGLTSRTVPPNTEFHCLLGDDIVLNWPSH